MYYSLISNASGEIVEQDQSNLQAWTMDSDLANDLVSSGWVENDGVFEFPQTGEFCVIVEK